MAPITVLGIIDKRARLSGPMRVRDQAALDPTCLYGKAFSTTAQAPDLRRRSSVGEL